MKYLFKKNQKQYKKNKKNLFWFKKNLELIISNQIKNFLLILLLK